MYIAHTCRIECLKTLTISSILCQNIDSCLYQGSFCNLIVLLINTRASDSIELIIGILLPCNLTFPSITFSVFATWVTINYWIYGKMCNLFDFLSYLMWIFFVLDSWNYLCMWCIIPQTYFILVPWYCALPILEYQKIHKDQE